MKSSLQVGDELAATVAVAPRVTLADLEAKVMQEYWFTAADAAAALGSPKASSPGPMDVLTIYVIVLTNGWTLVGKSAPASIENFDREVGRKFAREDALKQLWPLEGYALRERLHAEAISPTVDPEPPAIVVEAEPPAIVVEAEPVVASFLQSPIMPTVGRVVLVRCGAASETHYRITNEVPALVTRVWGKNCVNLQILRDGDTPIAATSVPFDDSTFGPTYLGWRWMPYQKAVAAGETPPTKHAV